MLFLCCWLVFILCMPEWFQWLGFHIDLTQYIWSLHLERALSPMSCILKTSLAHDVVICFRPITTPTPGQGLLMHWGKVMSELG